MVVIWSPDAANDLDQIREYYSRRSTRATIRIISRIRSVIDIIARTPKIAPIELLLDDRFERFRSFVVRKNHKIIYHIENDKIHIDRIWDCRRNPAALRKIVSKT